MNVRQLTGADAAVFQAVRLRSLKEHPEAFGSSYEEECKVPQEATAQLLSASDNYLFGAFGEGQLLGIINLNRQPRVKTRHRAGIGAMYVVPEARGAGLGQALMTAALEQARTMDGVEDVVLAVTVGNESARNLYLRFGFVSFSIDPRYIKINDQYFDIEWMILRINQNG